MRRITDAELKSILLEILGHINDVCTSEDIPFYLAYGTALGAVRHSGFIPWDDDVDIFMFRDGFERYISADEGTGGRYRLVCTENQPEYTLPLPKVIDTSTLLRQTEQIETFELGVYVDVFILDAVPEDVDARRSMYGKLDRLQRLWGAAQYAATDSTPALKAIVKKLLNIRGPRHYSIKIDEISQTGMAKAGAGYVCPCIYTCYGRERETYPREWFDGEPRQLPFCGMDLPVPSRVEDYLTKVYGDYMQLPPVEQRKSHHCFEAFWKDAE